MLVLEGKRVDEKHVRQLPSVGRRYNKSEIEEKLEFLYRIMDKDSALYQGGDAIADVISKDLISLYELCLKYNQTEFPRSFNDGKYCYATRVFKVYASVEPWDLKRIEYVFVNGMFWPLQGAFLSRSIIREYFESCYCWKNPKAKKHVMTQEEIKSLGLPDNLNYTQIIKLQNGMGFALRTDVWENQFIRTRNCLNFLDLRVSDNG